ncbi:hypothetical protein PGA1_c14270 [Phaeobacter inhibens DSM 17395]|nr:hypothetical protein PGA1_c14270 [Phaeobacter inhibens DSM 17395]
MGSGVANRGAVAADVGSLLIVGEWSHEHPADYQYWIWSIYAPQLGSRHVCGDDFGRARCRCLDRQSLSFQAVASDLARGGIPRAFLLFLTSADKPDTHGLSCKKIGF